MKQTLAAHLEKFRIKGAKTLYSQFFQLIDYTLHEYHPLMPWLEAYVIDLDVLEHSLEYLPIELVYYLEEIRIHLNDKKQYVYTYNIDNQKRHTYIPPKDIIPFETLLTTYTEILVSTTQGKQKSEYTYKKV